MRITPKITKRISLGRTTAAKTFTRNNNSRSRCGAGSMSVARRPAVPTTIAGQNGAQLAQSTKVSVTGCAVVKKAVVKEKAKAAKRAGRGER
jgi:hypothetical protein